VSGFQTGSWFVAGLRVPVLRVDAREPGRRRAGNRRAEVRQHDRESGEDDEKVREWLRTAAGVSGFIGFAVGRTDFWQPLVDFRAKKITREAAVTEIARRYREFVDTFESARAKSNAA